VFFRFKMLLEENFEELVRLNTREHGKTLVESRGDVRRGSRWWSSRAGFRRC
jgi:acyl-CoA reductase-like NAD-dependent aldehyde dehydrogenase